MTAVEVGIVKPTDAPAPRARVEPWHGRSGTRYAALLVEDAEATLASARAAGATVVQDVVAHRPGARYAMVTDPEGNVWELLEER